MPSSEQRSRTLFQSLLRLFTQEPDQSLLSFDQVQTLLRSRTEFNRGTQRINVGHIVGSVGRYRDFNRAFLPLNKAVQAHVNEVRRDLHQLPPIDVYQIGEVYFVRDGNHRVALARQLSWDTIEAHVTEIRARVPLTPDVDVDDLIVKVEYAEFLQQTGLDGARPHQKIELTEPGRYRILLEHIEVHRYYLGLEQQRDVSKQEAAASWYDTVYQPVVEALRDTEIMREFPSRTEADLYLWVAYHRERLKERFGDMPADREVATSLAEQFSDRPVTRFVKSIARAMRAAVKAATESPEPPNKS